jgi:hypothetical protein
MLVRVLGKRRSFTLSVGIGIGEATMEISMQVSQKLKTKLPYGMAIPLLGRYPKECKSAYNRDTCTPIFIAPLFTQ